MTLERLLFAAEGRLRAPWRLIAFALAAYFGLAVAQGIVYPVASGAAALLGVRPSFGPWLLVIALLLAHLVSVRWIDRRDWRLVYLDRTASRPRLLVRGLAIGVLAIAIPVLLLLAAGWLRVEPAPEGTGWWDAAWRVTLLLAPAALWEELAFRGYLFSVLREAAGPAVAVGATSLLFGLIHLSNPGADARSTALVTLAGVFLGVVLLATGSLYAAWMAHLGWNWAMAVLFHTAVSGLPFATPDYRLVDAGPDWVTGGVWGPEGGVGAALGMIGSVVYLLVWRGALGRHAGRLTTDSNFMARRISRGEPME